MPPKKVVKETSPDTNTNTVVTKTKKPVVKKPTSLPSPSINTKLFQQDNTKLIRVLEKMTKTLERLSKDQEEFNTNFDSLSNYTEDELNEMDFKLRTKNEECYNYLHELNKTYTEKQFTLENELSERTYVLETKYKQLEQELDSAYSTHTVNQLQEVLESKYNRVVVDRFTYDEMENELEKMRTKQDEITKELQAKLHKELNARLETGKLQHLVDTSSMTAQIENQKREISVLSSTIQSLKEEIQAQRNLTESVANATQKQLTQNFGK